MKKKMTFIVVSIVIVGVVSCMYNGDFEVDNLGSIWLSTPNKLGKSDTLILDTNNFARYYSSETDQWLESTYLPFQDTLLLLPRKNSIADDEAYVKPHRAYYFLYAEDTLKLVKQVEVIDDDTGIYLDFEPYYMIKQQ